MHVGIQFACFVAWLKHVLIAFGPLGSFFCIFLLYILLSNLYNKSANTEYQEILCLGLKFELEARSHAK